MNRLLDSIGEYFRRHPEAKLQVKTYSDLEFKGSILEGNTIRIFGSLEEFKTIINESMKGKCKICGCTERHACYHPEFGPCWWVDTNKDLCSHCVELKDDPSVERPSVRTAAADAL